MGSINNGAHVRTRLCSEQPSTSYSSIQPAHPVANNHVDNEQDQDSDLRPLLSTQQQNREMPCNGEGTGKLRKLYGLKFRIFIHAF